MNRMSQMWTNIEFFLKSQFVFLTKLDNICQDVNDDVKNMFTSSAVCDAMDKVADVMGLPRAHVLPLKNYESETKLKTAVDILLMEDRSYF